MWNEGFRIVEDIYTLMQIPVRQPDGTLARRQPKPRLMASYYDKMAKIFAVAGNKLFHAYAWHKYYGLTKCVRSGWGRAGLGMGVIELGRESSWGGVMD